jgi:hypothetical protein
VVKEIGINFNERETKKSFYSKTEILTKLTNQQTIVGL